MPARIAVSGEVDYCGVIFIFFLASFKKKVATKKTYQAMKV